MSVQKQLTDNLGTVFQSERLVYTALEDTDRGKDLWWKCRSSDVVNRGLLEGGQPVPPSRAESDKDLSETLTGRKPLLAVMICLPATTATTAAAPEQEPEPVGFLILNSSFAGVVASYVLGILGQHQGKGYGRESINWAADYAFKWCRVRKLAIGAISYNERALHLYRTLGFVQEARVRSVVYMYGAWYDLVDFGMLREEWEKLRGISA